MFNHIAAEFFRARKNLGIRVLYAVGILFPMAVFLFPIIFFGSNEMSNYFSVYLEDMVSFSLAGGLVGAVVFVAFTYKDKDIRLIYSTFKSSRFKAYMEDLFSIFFLLTVFCFFEILLCLFLGYIGSLISGQDFVYYKEFLHEVRYAYIISILFAVIAFALTNVFNSPAFAVIVAIFLAGTGDVLMTNGRTEFLRRLGRLLVSPHIIPIDGTIPHQENLIIVILLFYTGLGIFFNKRREL